MRIIVVLQARLGSTRLPGKVLADVNGEPMIIHVVRRAAAIHGITDLTVAIPDLSDDDPLDLVLRRAGLSVVRGSAHDVLRRYAAAIEATRADVVVRITSDCPLLSPAVSGAVLREFLAGGPCDYASNTIQRTYPRGLDTEVVTAAALREAAHEASSSVEREHVTPFVWRQPSRFALCSITDEVDRSSLRWTVDTPRDLAFVRAVYREVGSDAEYADVLDLLERRPALAQLNAGVAQKEIGV